MRPTLLFRVHAVQRMFERNISIKRVKEAVDSGLTIEDYTAEMPEPARLILGYQGNRSFHLVASENPEENVTTIITVYLPDPRQWNKNFRSRKA